MSSSTLAQKDGAAQLSLLQKLAIPERIRFYFNVATALVTGAFRDPASTSPTLKEHVQYAALRNFHHGFSPLQHHYLAPPTDDAYAASCAAHAQPPLSETLPDGTRAHWIGPRTAKRVIVHFHGGGYMLPCFEYMFEYLHGLRAALRASLQPVTADADAEDDLTPSILVLSYDLAPTRRFPRQLTQAVALFQHLLHTLQRPASDFIITGDSAGGNLALALLSHIAHPHPAVPRLSLARGDKFRGVVLVSPWSCFDLSHASYITKAQKDLISAEFLTQCSEAFLGTRHPHPEEEAPERAPFTQPACAPPQWWSAVPVDRVLITAGTEEVFVDGIRTLAKNMTEGLREMGESEERVEVLIAEGEVHEAPQTEYLLKQRKGISSRAVEGWIKERLT